MAARARAARSTTTASPPAIRWTRRKPSTTYPSTTTRRWGQQPVQVRQQPVGCRQSVYTRWRCRCRCSVRACRSFISAPTSCGQSPCSATATTRGLVQRGGFQLPGQQLNKGLPRADKDGDNWPLIRRIIVDPQAKPGSADIVAAKRRFLELLKIRSDSQLFQLESAPAGAAAPAFPQYRARTAAWVIAFSPADNPREGATGPPLQRFDGGDQCIGQAGSPAGRRWLSVASGAQSLGRPDQPSGNGSNGDVRGSGIHDDGVRPAQTRR